MIELEKLVHDLEASLYVPKGKNKNIKITGVASLEKAKEGDLSFFVEHRFNGLAKETKASAILVTEVYKDLDYIQIVHPVPRLAMALASQKLYPQFHSFSGKSPLAFIHPDAEVDESVTLYPNSFVDRGAKIGPNCVLYSGVHVGQNCELAENCVLYPNVVILHGSLLGKRVVIQSGSVIGSNGFGFVPTKDENVRVPQLGKVVLEDDVQVGALSTIDRATFDQTIVRRGTKIDSQVHVGHNVDVGELSLVCAQVGFGGHSKVGKRFIAAGQAAVGAAVTVGDHITFGPRAGTMQDQNEPGEYLGVPLTKKKDWIRQMVALKRLPEFMKKNP